MFSTKKGLPSSSIGLYWTDEELIMLLVRMAKGPPFPSNVIDDVNPYHYNPSNLPEDFWFYIRSDQKKDAECGFWKAKDKPLEVFCNSSYMGLRSTLEFYEAPHAHKTNWVMQEYSITHTGQHSFNNLKGPKSLCRVFLTSGTIENKILQQKLDSTESVGAIYFHQKPSAAPETSNSLGLSGAQARSKGDTAGPLQISEGVENLDEMDCFARGDYLELDDLVNPRSSSSSSGDSSCMTISSDECFDSLELLKDLEDEINKTEEGKTANLKYNMAPSAKPDDVVIHAVPLGSFVCRGNECQSPNEVVEKKRARDKRVADNAFETQNVKDGDRNKNASSSEHETSSSGSDKSVLHGEKKKASVHRLKKLKRKYFCFKPF